MEIATMNCVLCGLFKSDKGNVIHLSSTDESKNHARLHFGQVKMFDDGELEEGQMFERCFPKSPRKMHQVGSWQGRQSLIDFCRSLFGKQPKASHVHCNLCGTDISIVNRGKYLTTECVIAHACVHAGVKPLKCRCCEKSFRNRANIWERFKRAHGGTMIREDFEYQFEIFYDEISNSLKSCFTEFKDGAQKKMKNKLRDVLQVRCHMTNGSDLAVQRQLFFSRTIKKSVSSDGKVKCRLCSEKIKCREIAKSSGHLIIVSAIHHAQYHLRKPLYRCGACNRSLKTYPATQTHLRTKHSLGMEKNHVCFADKFHSDILAIFALCFEKRCSAD